MSIDITTLRILKDKEKYEKYVRHVPAGLLDQKMAIILSDYGSYFKEHPDVTKIESEPFTTWFIGFKHPTLQEEPKAIYRELIKKIDTDVSEAIEKGYMTRLHEAEAASKLVAIAEAWNEGSAGADLASLLRDAMDDLDQKLEKKAKVQQILTPIEDLLKAEENSTGFHWRWDELEQCMKPLVAGDFGILAGRPDKGKTTAIADLATHWAAQVDELYPDERSCIMWLNNEGPGDRIVTRTFQSALNATMEELVARSNAKTLRQEYAQALGGRGGTLRIFDIHDMWNHEVEELIKLHKPRGIIFDMIDNIKFGGSANNNGQRTDQLLEAMYQWGRWMAVKHGCFVLATSQISADGDGIQYPTLPMLKDSKTGKQGAADFIITIGASNDPALGQYRYIGTTKNKKLKTGKKPPQAAMTFDGDRGRYRIIA